MKATYWVTIKNERVYPFETFEEAKELADKLFAQGERVGFSTTYPEVNKELIQPCDRYLAAQKAIA